MEEVLEQVPEIVMMEAPDYSDYLSFFNRKAYIVKSPHPGITLTVYLGDMFQLYYLHNFPPFYCR